MTDLIDGVLDWGEDRYDQYLTRVEQEQLESDFLYDAWRAEQEGFDDDFFEREYDEDSWV